MAVAAIPQAETPAKESARPISIFDRERPIREVMAPSEAPHGKLVLDSKQCDALTHAHISIKRGLETLVLLVEGVEDLINSLAHDEAMAEVYQDRTEALNYVIGTIEGFLYDADDVVEGEYGFRAAQKRRQAERNAAMQNGGGAHV